MNIVDTSVVWFFRVAAAIGVALPYLALICWVVTFSAWWVHTKSWKTRVAFLALNIVIGFSGFALRWDVTHDFKYSDIAWKVSK